MNNTQFHSVISVHSLSKRYGGVQALNSLDLNLEQNLVHAIVGENGAGKSTFMKILSGGVTPDSGSIKLNGETYSEISVPLAKNLELALCTKSYGSFNIEMYSQTFSLIVKFAEDIYCK